MNIYTNYDYLPNIQYSLDGETFNDYTPNEIIHFIFN